MSTAPATTPVKTPRPQTAKWKPLIKPEVRGKKKLELDIPQDQFDAIEQYGKQILNGSSIAHICLAALQHFVETEVEPALVAVSRINPSVEAAVNGKGEAKQ